MATNVLLCIAPGLYDLTKGKAYEILSCTRTHDSVDSRLLVEVEDDEGNIITVLGDRFKPLSYFS